MTIMHGEKKYILNNGSGMPHIGALLQAYFKQKRTYQSALARAIKREPQTLYKYKRNHSLQAAILWELSHALEHNFFADLAAALPDTFSRNSDSEPDEKEEQIATLQAEIVRLKQDKELLMRIMQEGK
jgi:transcriptional regulator with XRE-family HTH domain